MRVVTVFAAALLVCAGVASADESYGIPKLSGGRVDARAARDAESGITRFEYRLINASPQLRITMLSIDISSTEDREALSAEGLSFVNPAGSAATKLNLSRIGSGGFVPVGSASDPEGWVAVIGPNATLAWGVYKETAKGRPGDTVAVFVATSRGLPGIRRATLDPDVFDYGPGMDDPGVDPVALVEAVKAADQVLRTLGPVAPPKNLDLVAFADTIASLRGEAATLGWVRAGADVSNVDALLGQLRSELASSAFGPARATASAFIAAVEGASCAELDCPPERAMTAEARALLALNMAFLRDRLPAPVAP